MIGLSVIDNADGSGGVATITGSIPGSSNQLYYAAYSGLTAPTGLSWAVYGSPRAGDGTIPVTLPLGLYLWYVDSLAAGSHVVTPVVSQSLSDNSIEAVHYASLLAIQGRIRGLNLTDLPTAKVVIQWLPRVLDDIDNANLPLVIISPYGKEEEIGILSNLDDIQYPIPVAIIDRMNQDNFSNVGKYLGWRSRIWKAIRHQRLAGVPSIYTVDVKPSWVIDPQLALKANLFVSALLVLPRSRESRG